MAILFILLIVFFIYKEKFRFFFLISLYFKIAVKNILLSMLYFKNNLQEIFRKKKITYLLDLSFRPPKRQFFKYLRTTTFNLKKITLCFLAITGEIKHKILTC